jgi:hypothetical protein
MRGDGPLALQDMDTTSLLAKASLVKACVLHDSGSIFYIIRATTRRPSCFSQDFNGYATGHLSPSMISRSKTYTKQSSPHLHIKCRLLKDGRKPLEYLSVQHGRK